MNLNEIMGQNVQSANELGELFGSKNEQDLPKEEEFTEEDMMEEEEDIEDEDEAYYEIEQRASEEFGDAKMDIIKAEMSDEEFKEWLDDYRIIHGVEDNEKTAAV